MDGYEERLGQLEMAARCADIVQHGGVGAFQAGTGSGKGIAYLAPAVLRSLYDDKMPTTIVATSTLALQDQLYRKDIPLLQRLFRPELTYSQAKGRGNYISIRRASLAAEDGNSTALRVLRDLRGTPSGTKQDLTWSPGGAWMAVRSDADDCLGRVCPHVGECFYYRSRQGGRKGSGHIIVTNHHMLLASYLLPEDVSPLPLGENNIVIVDEAHRLAATGRDIFGLSINSQALRVLLTGLLHPRTLEGMLPRTTELFGKSCSHPVDVASNFVDIYRGRFKEVFTALAETVREYEQEWRRKGSYQSSYDGGESVEKWIPPEDSKRSYWQPVVKYLDVIAEMAGDILDPLDELADHVGGLAQDPAEKAHAGALALRAKRFAEIVTCVESFKKIEDAEHARLIQCSTPPKRASSWQTMTVDVKPLDVAPSLAGTLWSHKSVILSSATLFPGEGDARYLRRELGLPDKAETLNIRSPFNFERSPLYLCDLSVSHRKSNYTKWLAESVVKLVRASGGGAFVLFTSYKKMSETYDYAKADLQRYQMLKQGDAPTHELVSRFRARQDSVLFGVDTFWEGVDIQGQALRQVIVTQVPFAQPSGIVGAQIRFLEAQGENPFSALQLPHAALRLQQGTGRLLRHTEDIGCVVILDSRVVYKQYGSYLLSSLPWEKHKVGSADEIAKWIQGVAGAPRAPRAVGQDAVQDNGDLWRR